MSFYLISKALHVAAGFGLFAALGAACLAPPESRRAAMILHGVSATLLLLLGLHLLFSTGQHQVGAWWHAKLVIWLLLAIAPALAARRLLPPALLLAIALVLGAIASWLPLARPF